MRHEIDIKVYTDNTESHDRSVSIRRGPGTTEDYIVDLCHVLGEFYASLCQENEAGAVQFLDSLVKTIGTSKKLRFLCTTYANDKNNGYEGGGANA